MGRRYLSEGKYTKRRWTETVELEKKYTDTLQACEKDLGDALPDVKEGLFKIMWNLGKTRKNTLEDFSPDFIWLWRSQAVWAGRTSIEASARSAHGHAGDREDLRALQQAPHGD